MTSDNDDHYTIHTVVITTKPCCVIAVCQMCTKSVHTNHTTSHLLHSDAIDIDCLIEQASHQTLDTDVIITLTDNRIHVPFK